MCATGLSTIFVFVVANLGAASVPDADAVCAAAERLGVPGVAYAVVSADSRQIRTCGHAGPDDAPAVMPDTPFEAASLSKTVFATLFVEALADTALRLDAPLASSAMPARIKDTESYARLTPRLILSHQSGLPNWSGDALDPVRDDPLEFERPPGSGYGYSGEAFELLKTHAAAVTGHELETWFKARRDAFGMSRSSYLGPPGAETNAAVGRGGQSPRGLASGEYANAAASLITTASDYARFLQYLLSNPALLDTLLTPEVDVDAGAGGSIAWGLGWGIFERPDGTRLGFHWGDNYQFKAFVAIDPAAGRAVVFFANGFEGLRLVDVIVEPVVGDMRYVRDWLGYEGD